MRVKLRAKLKKTQNFYGPQSEIEGKSLEVMEKSFTGDCLCFVEDERGQTKGLIDVWKCDIESYEGQEYGRSPLQSMMSDILRLRSIMNRGRV